MSFELLYICDNDMHTFAQDCGLSSCDKCDFSFLIPIQKSDERFVAILEKYEVEHGNGSEEITQQKFDEFIQQANEYLMIGDNDSALSAYRSALALDVDNALVEKEIAKIQEKKEEGIKKAEFDDYINKVGIAITSRNKKQAYHFLKLAFETGVNPEKVKQKEEELAQVDWEDVVIDLPFIEKGLGIFLLDVSDSMNEKIVPGTNSITKKEMVAHSVAKAIFDNQKGKHRDKFMVSIFLFDHNIRPIAISSIQTIVTSHKTVQNFAKFILEEMNKYCNPNDMRTRLTDINQALEVGYKQALQFAKGEMKLIGQYKPLKNTVEFYDEKADDIEPKATPNVRMFLYTDGYQIKYKSKDPNVRKTDNDTTIYNPYHKLSKADKEIFNGADILMVAYLDSQDEYNKVPQELLDIVSKCPTHQEDQFVNISVGNVSDLKKFTKKLRMASGGSGYCEKCIGK